MLRNAFSLKLLYRFAEGESIRLGEEVRHELVVVRDDFCCIIHGRLRSCKANELSRNSSALMHELVEAVLTVSARLTKDDGTGVDTSIKPHAILGTRLSIAFHVELLDVRREPQQGLAVR